MEYRYAVKADLPALMEMTAQAKANFKAAGINQWQKGEPNEEGLSQGIGQKKVHVLDENGTAVGMLTIQTGDDPSYRTINGAWLNDEPYVGFHRVCVAESKKGQGIAARLFSCSEEYVKDKGIANIRIDTHPDNLSMQHALAKSGYTFCGTLTLADGSEKGDLRLGYQKKLMQ